MAFAAALTGGVALEAEEIETGNQESESLRNLRGSLRFIDLLGIGGERGSKEAETGSTESRLRREHTKASIFLDERFITNQVLELLHTSKFTVIGKVTQIWPNEEEFVNLYRRSVLSLAPALVQTMSLGMLRFLIGLAEGVEADDALAEFQAATGIEAPGDGGDDVGGVKSGDDQSDVMISQEAFNAVLPGVQSPAFQILPLALCA